MFLVIWIVYSGNRLAVGDCISTGARTGTYRIAEKMAGASSSPSGRSHFLLILRTDAGVSFRMLGIALGIGLF